MTTATDEQTRVELEIMLSRMHLGFQAAGAVIENYRRKHPLSDASDAPPQLYESPVRLPEAKSGRFAIKHTLLYGRHPVVSLRNSLLTGRPAKHVELNGHLVHQLTEDDGVWMSDLPIELNDMREQLDSARPRGHVLVGGLGLGIIAKWAARMPNVKSVTVVERSRDVIKLVHQPSDPFFVERADIYEYLKSAGCYDTYLLDTWQGTNEGTWWTEVMPARRIIANRFGARPRVTCWAENQMLGQCAKSAAAQGGFNWYLRSAPQTSIDPHDRPILHPGGYAEVGGTFRQSRRPCDG